MGSIEGRLQGEHERHCRAAAKDQEEDCKGCLIAFSSEYNRFRNQIQRYAAGKSHEETSIILARYVWECRSTRNCLVDGHILRAAARSGKRAQGDLRVPIRLLPSDEEGAMCRENDPRGAEHYPEASSAHAKTS